VVANEDIVKGYKVDTDTFIEVTKDELENVALESTRTIEIDEFVDRSEIDPRYLIRPCYLTPDGKVGHDAFAVIRETLREMNKLAIRRLVLTKHHRTRSLPVARSFLHSASLCTCDRLNPARRIDPPQAGFFFRLSNRRGLRGSFCLSLAPFGPSSSRQRSSPASANHAASCHIMATNVVPYRSSINR
jgi:hypothetical protein